MRCAFDGTAVVWCCAVDGRDALRRGQKGGEVSSMATEREEFWGAPYPILEESRIGAILPEYGPTGDGVRIVVVGGPDIRLEVQLKTVLRRLAAVHGRTLPALREAVSRQILKKTGLPLAISSSLVLLPLKVRRPRVARDPTEGFFNVLQVRRTWPAVKKNGRPSIELRGGKGVELLATREQAVNQLLIAVFAARTVL